jgi:plastocyanin
MKKLALSLALAAVAALAITACGSSSSSTSSSPSSTTSSTSGSSSTAAGGGGGGSSSGASTTLKVSADPSGALAYQEKSLSAKAGDVSVDFNNSSPLTHDVCIQSSNGSQLGCTDQIANSSSSHDFGNLQPGTYTFYCSVDGHEAAGMKGTLTVK